MRPIGIGDARAGTEVGRVALLRHRQGGEGGASVAQMRRERGRRERASEEEEEDIRWEMERNASGRVRWF